ncbi:DUF4145 domain-containing protein [Pendulispora rubella]|uniref:DUF4145 domain-containing protein n=1 Tax=Pendulispora rubella TaxID=2741070 RepID=A0ABZ2KSW0_9BACT
MLYLDGDPPVVYPPAMPRQVSEHVPAAIREEAHDAQRCLVNGIWRPAALMARRALEAACDDKSGGQATGMLAAKLKWLKENALITNRLYEQAEPLRVVGNSAAHGGPEITEDDAITTLEVLRRVLEALYDDEKIGDDVKAKHAYVKKKP